MRLRSVRKAVPGAGDVVAAVVAHARGTWVVGARIGKPLRVIGARRIEPGMHPTLAETLKQWRVSHVVRVAPLRETVVRVASVPGGSGEAVQSAIALLAEAELPASAPAHRVAGAVLAGALDAAMRRAILTGWVGAKPLPLAGEVPELWCTPAGALVALRGEKEQSIVWSEEESRAVFVLVRTDKGAAARVVVEEAVEGEAWEAVVSRVAAETAAMVGADAPAADPDSPVDVRARVEGDYPAVGWRGEYGLALGALLALADDPAGSRGLALLRAEAPKVPQPWVLRAADWLAVPKRAAVVGAAAAVLLLAGPAGLAWARSRIVTSKASQLQSAREKTRDVELRAAVYEQVELSRLPMTKLIADIGNAAPVGVTVLDLRLSAEQGVTIRGIADSRPLLSQFEKAIADTRMFASAPSARTQPSDEGKVQFDITVKTANPHVPVRPATDFVGQPLAVRLYGAGASNKATPVGAAKESARRPAADASATTESGARSDTGRRPSAAPSEAPPAAVTDEEIARMDIGQLIKGWSTRKAYVQKNPGLDAGTRERLQSEERKMRDRQDALKSGKAKSGGGA